MILIIINNDIIDCPKIKSLLTNKHWYGSLFCVKNTNNFSYSKDKIYCIVPREIYNNGPIYAGETGQDNLPPGETGWGGMAGPSSSYDEVHLYIN